VAYGDGRELIEEVDQLDLLHRAAADALDHAGQVAPVRVHVEVDLVGELAQLERHVDQHLHVALAERQQHEHQRAAGLRVDPADHPEVEQPDGVVGPQQVAGVRVGVEEALVEDLLVVQLEELPSGLRAGLPDRGLDDRHAVDDLVHHEQAARGQLVVAEGHGHAAARRRDLGHPLDVACLLAEVELLAQRPGHLLDERRQVEHATDPAGPSERADGGIEQLQVLLDAVGGGRPLDLDHDAVPVGEPRAMHLADRARGERLGLDPGEHVLPRHAQLLLHRRHDLRL
jgi:hypothetical protein